MAQPHAIATAISTAVVVTETSRSSPHSAMSVMATATADVTATKPVASTFRRNSWTSPMASRKATASGITEPSVSSRASRCTTAEPPALTSMTESSKSMLRNTVSARPASPLSDPPILAVTRPEAPVITGIRLRPAEAPVRLELGDARVRGEILGHGGDGCGDFRIVELAGDRVDEQEEVGHAQLERAHHDTLGVEPLARLVGPTPAGRAFEDDTTQVRPDEQDAGEDDPRGDSELHLSLPPSGVPDMRLGARRSVTVAGFENDRSIGSGWRATARRRGLQPSTLPSPESLRGR